VQPMALVAKNIGLDAPNDARRRMDWYLRTEWFMSLSIVRPSSSSSAQETSSEPCNLRGYEHWGEEQQEEQEEEQPQQGLLTGSDAEGVWTAAQMLKRKEKVKAAAR